MPWKDLGQQFTSNPAILDALNKCGGNYIVESVRLHTVDISKDLCITPANICAIRRVDNYNTHFGYPRGVWKPTQNIDAFMQVDELIKSKDLTIEHMGVLQSGCICYMLCRLAVDKLMVSSDEIRAYCLVSNHHDGQTSIRFSFIPIRVRGSISLSMQRRNEAKIFRVRHSKQTASRLVDVNTSLQMMKISFDETIDLYRRMANTPITALADYINYVFEIDEITPQQQNIHDQIDRILHVGRTAVAGQISVWNLYVSICEYVNFNIGRGSQSQRIFRLWMGDNSKVQQRAIDYACRIVNSSP